MKQNHEKFVHVKDIFQSKSYNSGTVVFKILSVK